MRSSILMFQAGMVLIGIGLSAYAKGQPGIEAALYGGVVALANTMMLIRRIDRVGSADAASLQRGMALLYLSAVLRFVFVLVALAVGMGLFKLSPLPLIGTFVGAQAAYILMIMRPHS